MKRHIFLILLIVGSIYANNHNVKPIEGYVPNKETAITIAVAVLTPIYEKNNIENKKPFSANLKDGVWYVSGSLPEGSLGGVPEVEIDKKSAQILRVTHGK